MDRPLARAGVRPICRIVIAAATISSVLVGSLGLRAQTLTDPNVQTKSRAASAAKSHPAAHEKSCSVFGAGFVNIPGTDACIKIGGFAGTEATASPGR